MNLFSPRASRARLPMIVESVDFFRQGGEFGKEIEAGYVSEDSFLLCFSKSTGCELAQLREECLVDSFEIEARLALHTCSKAGRESSNKVREEIDRHQMKAHISFGHLHPGDGEAFLELRTVRDLQAIVILFVRRDG